MTPNVMLRRNRSVLVVNRQGPYRVVVGSQAPMVPLAFGGQILFPAIENASSNPNTLDDYEEGTFTPAFTAATTPPTGVTYAIQSGDYVKWGRLVWVSLSIFLTSKGSGGVGAINLTGLPFIVATGHQPMVLPASFHNVDFDAGFTFAQCVFQAGTTQCTMIEMGDNIAQQGLAWANATNTSLWRGNAVYLTDN